MSLESASQSLEAEVQKSSDCKRYRCDVCEMSFSTKIYLNYHRNRHTGNRPFPCKFMGCNLKFCSPMDRHNHMKAKHDFQPPRTALANGETCSKCQFRTPDDLSMIEHWNKSHIPLFKLQQSARKS